MQMQLWRFCRLPWLKQLEAHSTTTDIQPALCWHPPGEEQVVEGATRDLCNADGALHLAWLPINLRVQKFSELIYP
jgi:hypothetical protein